MVIYAYHVDILEDKKAHGTFPLSVVLLNYIKGQKISEEFFLISNSSKKQRETFPTSILKCSRIKKN